MIPTFILQMWLLGVVSLGLLGGAIYAGREWQERSWGWDPVRQQSVFSPHLGWNEDTALLALALGAGIVVLFGGSLIKAVLRLLKKGAGTGSVELPASPTVHTLQRPDGSRLHVECYGPEDGTPIVLSHGWTLDGSEWKYLLHAISRKFRLIVWDQAGMGRSVRPSTGDYSLEKMAKDLHAVLELNSGRPAILLGHSIGGMIILTFCRLFGKELGSRVLGVVLTHTTPTDPVHTTSGAAFYTAIEKPVLVPLMYLTMALSPLVWILNWLSYRNGSAHLTVMRSSFAGGETWEQIDHFARLQVKASPAVMARGMLGMMRYDASAVLASIPVPALVVVADRDTTTKPEASVWLESAIPQARMVSLSPAKHLGLIEHNAEFTTVVQNFAGKCQADHRAALGTSTPAPSRSNIEV
ncbi:MAG: alpha/beta hydrolase [Prosthecobacter sp.]|nr:alpha/beta hydrolase [Prosthecobacter sp.]